MSTVQAVVACMAIVCGAGLLAWVAHCAARVVDAWLRSPRSTCSPYTSAEPLRLPESDTPRRKAR